MFKKLFNKIFNLRPAVEVKQAKALNEQHSLLSANIQEPSATESKLRSSDSYVRQAKSHLSNSNETAEEAQQIDLSALFYSLLFPMSSHKNGGMANNLERSILAEINIAFSAPQDIAAKVLKLPRRITELDHQLSQDGIETKQVLRLIEQDPVLSVEVLKLCNSSAFKRSDKDITNLQQAIVQLGRAQLRQFVRSCLVKEMIDIKPIYFRRFGAEIWRHSMQVAFIASDLAEEDADTVFLLGLLHDVGKIAIFKMLLDAFEKAEPGEQPSSALFKQVMTTKSLGLSALLAKHWQLPAQFEFQLAQLTNSDYRPTDAMALAVWRANIISECSMLRQKDKLKQDDLQQLLQQVGLNQSEFEVIHQKLICF
ncbi:HDOD domain-containing protein [Shewanella sp. UCD-KL21]|uniref:HDOD domain-containing protein n=1 Tax=Shewanella sp. UCD-KL21 TaxID=1917164 RepID=UPI0009708524|nr:HDOD domain-containing protein [Shewanella sp. UCD-KL21]